MGTSSSLPKYDLINAETIRLPPCKKYKDKIDMGKAKRLSYEMLIDEEMKKNAIER